MAKHRGQTWLFESRPGVLATGTVAGTVESQGRWETRLICG